MTLSTACTADLGHPCDAGGRDDNDDPIPCVRCAEYLRSVEAEARRECAVRVQSERDPEGYRRDMLDAGRGHLLGRDER